MEAPGSPFVWLKDKTGQVAKGLECHTKQMFQLLVGSGQVCEAHRKKRALKRSPLQKALASSSVYDTMESAKMLKVTKGNEEGEGREKG